MSWMSTISSSSNDDTSASSSAIKEILPFDKCPDCSSQFECIRNSVSERVSVVKWPFILPCKHTVCEGCIRKRCISQTNFCPICNEKFDVPRNQLLRLHEILQPHFAIIGSLVWRKNNPETEHHNPWTGFADEIEMELIENNSSKLVFLFDHCHEHTDQFVNIQCLECEDTFCCYCFLENHEGHRSQYLYKITDNEMVELEKRRTELEVILSELLNSRKQVKELMTFDSPSLKQEVGCLFAELHAKVHVAERNIRKLISTLNPKSVARSNLNDITKVINSGIGRVKHILKYYPILSTTNKSINVRALKEEFSTIKELPCKLVQAEKNPKPIELKTSELWNQVEDLISLETATSLNYSLEAIADWSIAKEKFDVEQMKQEIDIPKSNSDCSSNSKSVEQTDSDSLKSLKDEPSGSRSNNVENVIPCVVSHINSLNSIFIQKYMLLEVLRKINAGIKPYRKVFIKDIKIGGVYCAPVIFRKKECWRRAQLKQIELTENGQLYKMFFLDYGLTKSMTLDKIHTLNREFVNRGPLAFECKLTNPRNLEFDSNAHLRLAKIVFGRKLYMSFVNDSTTRDVKEIDLFIKTPKGNVSVLFFLNKKIEPDAKEIPYNPEYSFFLNGKIFEIGDEETVIVTYIRDPDYICVYLARNREYFNKMKEKLDNFYENSCPLNCPPTVNSSLIVNYVDEFFGNFHRANVISVNETKREVDVLFVDWGKIVTVSWDSLRPVTVDFIKAEAHGIIVKLADIERCDMATPWSLNVVQCLNTQLAKNKECKLIVRGIEPLQVALFQQGPSADICLNSLLVENNMAVSTGPISQTIYWPTTIEDDPDDDDLYLQMLKKAEKIIIDDGDNLPSSSQVREQVDIINFKSPDLICVKLVKFKEEEEKMEQELQIHYMSGKAKRKDTWSTSEKCVVFEPEKDRFFRAIIKENRKRDQYIVYLYDHAREIMVSKENIYVQEDYFLGFSCHVITCCLAGVRPTGDVDKWSQLALQILLKVFLKYKLIYIQKEAIDTHMKLLRVRMWYCLTTSLELAAVKYVSVNQLLIESGLAFVTSPTTVPTIEEPSNIKEDTQTCIEEIKQTSPFEMARQKSWPESSKIINTNFKATVICIDYLRGYFLIRDKKMRNEYIRIESGLTEKLNSLKLNEVAPIFEVGDMCSVFYDGKWYRSTILEVFDKKRCLVEMIDFGSEHNIPYDNVSKIIMYPDLSPLVYKVELYDLYSRNNKWTSEDFDLFRDLVPKDVQVEIKGNSDLGIPFVEFYYDDGSSVNDYITQKSSHIYRKENCGTLSLEPDTEYGTCLNYNYHCLDAILNQEKLFLVDVIKRENKFHVILCSKQPFESTDKVNITESIETQITKQPPLQDIVNGAICICLHPQKNIWARALISNSDCAQFGFVLTFFVDYGTMDMVPITSLREIRSDWLEFPVYYHMAELNFEILQTAQTDDVLNFFDDFKLKEISVEIVSQDPLKIHLTQNKKIIYDSFVTSATIKLL